MWMAVGVIGFLGFLLFLVVGIYSLIRKNGKARKNFMISGIALVLFLIGAIGNAEPVSKETSFQSEVKQLDPSELDRLNKYATQIRGGAFLKEVKVVENNATITLFGNYQDFKSLNTNSTISEKDFNDYWNTGDAINKALMEEPVRVLREFLALKQVRLLIVSAGKEYSSEIDRKTAEDYFQVNLEELNKDKNLDLWREKIVKPYFNDAEREKYINKFVHIK